MSYDIENEERIKAELEGDNALSRLIVEWRTDLVADAHAAGRKEAFEEVREKWLTLQKQEAGKNKDATTDYRLAAAFFQMWVWLEQDKDGEK